MLYLTVILLFFCLHNIDGVNYQPEQIHLSYTGFFFYIIINLILLLRKKNKVFSMKWL